MLQIQVHDGICKKAAPYEVHDKLEFDNIVGRRGDCYVRSFIRVDEMR